MKERTSCKIGKLLLYVYSLTCFFQAQTLKLHIAGMEIAINRILLIVFIFDLFFSYITTSRSKRLCFGGDYYCFLKVWLTWQAVTLCFGIRNGITGWIRLTWLILVFCVSAFALCKYITSIEQLYKLLCLMQIGILGQLLIGLYEHCTGIYYWTSYKEVFESAIWYKMKRYPCAMQTNPNDFAVLMFFGILFSMVMVGVYKNLIMKLISIFIIGMGMYMIIISDSRATLLGVVVAIVFYVAQMLLNKKKLTNKGFILTLILVPIAMVCVLANADSIASKMSIDLAGASESARLNIYMKGFMDLLKSIGIGTGWHGGAYHCFAIEVLAESGIIVFIVFVLALWDIYRKLNYISKHGVIKRTVRTANYLKAGFVGFLVASLSPASTLNIEWMGLMVAVFAVFSSLAYDKCGEKGIYEI